MVRSKGSRLNGMGEYFHPRNLGKDIIEDWRRRLPLYVSDWTDAWNYRVVPSVVYIFFANILPAIAFAQDMFDRTDGAYGVNEVLMGSALGGIVFGLFAGQPLCVVGVTGPITIFTYTVFEIIVPKHVNFFAFMCWINIWAFIMHVVIAVCNGVRFMKYITKFSADIFGCFINIIYVEKGIQILIRQFNFVQSATGTELAASYFQIVTALCILIFGVVFVMVVGDPNGFWGTPKLRKFVADYSLPIIVVFFTGFTFFPGRIGHLKDHVQRLSTSKAYYPSPHASNYGREYGWFIHFWNIPVGYVFLAIPFAILLTLLFYFDHNISSIMAQSSDYHFTKPSSFHWDFVLLGITTLVAGFLGIPAPNGLIPQAPLHVQSLATDKRDPSTGALYVVDQRFTNTLQGLATIGLMSGPLLRVLHLVPQGVLAGLFFMMGVPGLLGNELIRRLELLITDPRHQDPNEPLNKLPKWRLFLFLVLSGIGVAGEVAITQTIAAIGFPGVLFAFMVIGALLPKFWNHEELQVLDSPAASDYIMSTLDHKLRRRAEDDGAEQLSQETHATQGTQGTRASHASHNSRGTQGTHASHAKQAPQANQDNQDNQASGVNEKSRPIWNHENSNTAKSE